MTKIFILIVYIGTGNSGGVTSIEFNSQLACEKARVEIVKDFSYRTWTWSKCVAKD